MRFCFPCRAMAAGTSILLIVCPASYPQEPSPSHGKHHKVWEWLNALSPDEQAKLHAARKQALQNPQVSAANERRKKANVEYHDLLRREMLKIDPSLKPLLDKESELRQRADF